MAGLIKKYRTSFPRVQNPEFEPPECLMIGSAGLDEMEEKATGIKVATARSRYGKEFLLKAAEDLLIAQEFRKMTCRWGEPFGTFSVAEGIKKLTGGK